MSDLAQIRGKRRVTQVDLAAAIGTTQSAVSRMEHQSDWHVSTLRSYIEALGGSLELVAIFPDEWTFAVTIPDRPQPLEPSE